MLADQDPQVNFPTTRWSLVEVIRHGNASACRQALQEILERYLPAMQAHLVRRKGLSPDAAEDLLQQFVLSKVIEKDLVSHAVRASGKFRTFLLTALDRFVIDCYRRQQAHKNMPHHGTVAPLGDRITQLASRQPVSDVFDATWARTVITEALRRMRSYCLSSSRNDVWEVFRLRVVEPILTGSQPLDMQTLMDRFGLRSPAQASNLLITAKRMFSRTLRSIIAEYAVDDTEIEEEIAQLRAALSSSPCRTEVTLDLSPTNHPR